MNLQLSSLPTRVFQRIMFMAQGSPKCLKLARAIVSNKHGLEIGGPSSTFSKHDNLPLYEVVATLDNCDFSNRTTWARHEDTYCFHENKPCGKTFITEGSHLHMIADHSYDFLLSSHNLEHFANPIRALKEWQRVVKPGGHLIIDLPNYRRTLDKRRQPTTINHMLEDFEQDRGEHDLTHVEEIVQAQHKDGRSKAAEQMRKLLQDNFNHRMMHHHAYNEANSKQLLEAAGLKVLAQASQLISHMYFVTQVS